MSGSVTLLPVFVQDPEDASPATPSAGERDPLYAALLGSNIGSSLGAAEREEELDTLDEPVVETLVARAPGPCSPPP